MSVAGSGWGRTRGTLGVRKSVQKGVAMRMERVTTRAGVEARLRGREKSLLL